MLWAQRPNGGDHGLREPTKSPPQGISLVPGIGSTRRKRVQPPKPNPFRLSATRPQPPRYTIFRSSRFKSWWHQERAGKGVNCRRSGLPPHRQLGADSCHSCDLTGLQDPTPINQLSGFKRPTAYVEFNVHLTHRAQRPLCDPAFLLAEGCGASIPSPSPIEAVVIPGEG
jgi:hypothetical protein